MSSYQARADFQKLLDALQTTSQVTERTKHSKIPSDCAGDISTYTIEQSVSEIGSRVFASRKDHFWHRIDGVVSVDHEDRVDAIDQHHVPVTTSTIPQYIHYHVRAGNCTIMFLCYLSGGVVLLHSMQQTTRCSKTDTLQFS